MASQRKKGRTQATASSALLDLRVVVADADAEGLMTALLKRHESLEIRPITYEINRYAGRDSGCRSDIRSLSSAFGPAGKLLVLFDRHGCGSDEPAETIERTAEEALGVDGAVIVVEPEIEAWLWIDRSPHVAEALGWEDYSMLREWLSNPDRVARNGQIVAADTPVWPPGRSKPVDPKSALLQSIEQAGVPKSTTVFSQIASRATFRDCRDRAFLKLLATLRRWYPRASSR